MAKKPSREIQVSGNTESGASVVKGIFRFNADCGVPLEDLLDLANTRNWVIDWTDFITLEDSLCV